MGDLLKESGEELQEEQGVTIDWAKVNWDEVDIPVDVIKKQGIYRDVLAETMERKAKIKELQRTLEAREESERPTNEETSENPVLKNLLKQVQSLAEIVSAQQAAAVVSKRELLAKAAGIPEGLWSLIPDGTEEEMRETIERIKPFVGTPESAAPIGVTGVDNVDALVKGLREKLEGKADSPYDIGVQKKLGGGIF